MTVDLYLVLAAILFAVGLAGFLIRRNTLILFMSTELMLNAANLVLVSMSWVHGKLDGQVAAFFVMVVAAAEVVVGLSLIVTIYRARRSISVDNEIALKG